MPEAAQAQAANTATASPQPAPIVNGVPVEPAQAAMPQTTAQALATPAPVNTTPAQALAHSDTPPIQTAQGAVPAGSQAAANIQPPSDQSTAGSEQAEDGVATPATAPDRATADGTAPGNSGSTGWTGGTGGSQIGTNTAGAVPESKTWQPPTARGLDLRG